MECCLQSLADSILREESILQILPSAETAGIKGLGSNSMSELVEGIVPSSSGALENLLGIAESY